MEHNDAQDKFLKAFFSSMEPLRLRLLSPKPAKKQAILRIVARQFSPDKRYTEQQVNEVLTPIYSDFAELRRALIDYRFMCRTRDGSTYWLNQEQPGQ